ncbi:MAG: glycogen debranching enzyme GlgX, partial [Thermoanaerobaculia bacterium]|nr:glycogen debranching enzyme GlgX [Thermoanaerobaculia bacterium]
MCAHERRSAAATATRGTRRNRPGAQWDGEGTRFRLVAPGAEAVELCLFSEDDEEKRHEMARSADRSWELYRSEVAPG